MSKSYDVDDASVRWVDPTGQTEYEMSWKRGSADIWMSGTNLNDGTEWRSPAPVEQPERFGPTTTTAEFFAWVAAFVATSS